MKARLGSILSFALIISLAVAGTCLAEDKNTRTDRNGVISVRIFISVQGMGSIPVGSCQTQNGCASAWVKAGQELPCYASPAQGWKFSHWLANGNYGSDQMSWRVMPRPGLTVTGVFIEE